MTLHIEIELRSRTVAERFSFAYVSNSYDKSIENVVDVVIERSGTGAATVLFTVTGGKESGEDYGVGKNFIGSDDGADIWINTDYETSVRQVSFADGVTSKTVSLTIVDNPVLELDRVMTLTLSNPSVGMVSGGTRTITIVDDNIPVTDTYRNIIDCTDPEKDYDSAEAAARDLDYPMVGNDSTDNTDALTRQMKWLNDNGGGILYVPTGNYRIDAPTGVATVNLYPGVSIVGDGRTLSIFRRDDTSIDNNPLLTPNTSPTFAVDQAPCSLLNISVDGRSDNIGSNCALVRAYGGAGAGRFLLRVEQCDLSNTLQSDGILTRANVDLAVYELNSTDCGRGGVTVTGGYSKINLKNLALYGNCGVHYEYSAAGYTGDLAMNEYDTQTVMDNIYVEGSFRPVIFVGASAAGTSMVGTNVSHVSTAKNCHFYGAGVTGMTYTFDDSVFSCGGTSGTSVGFCQIPGTMVFTKCQFVGYEHDVGASGKFLAVFPRIQFHIVGHTPTGQTVTFKGCNWTTSGEISADVAVFGILSSYAYMDKLHNNRVVLEDDGATHCEFASTIDSAFSYRYPGASSAARPGIFEATNVVFKCQPRLVDSVQRYIFEMRGSNVTPDNFILKLIDCYFSEAGNYWAYIYGGADGNEFRCQGITLTAAQNVIASSAAIADNVYGRPDSANGIMRTIIGTAGDNPDTANVSGLCEGANIYDRYVAGTTNWKCTTAGVGSAAAWENE